MKKRLLKTLFIVSVPAVPLVVCAEVLDFSKIVHWTGEGDQEAALIVQFDEPEATDPGAIVWGYRWHSGEDRTSDEMMREIACDASDLVIFVQYTGGMGYTLDGIGYSPDINATLDGIWFDYDSAVEDGNISFGYIFPNTGMGQTSAPGGAARDLSYDAIAEAADTHVIKHPLNQREYGYPAYDYDHWKLDRSRIGVPSVAERSYWRAGWYWGYWSFWIGDRGADIDDLSYSGMGMSSVKIYDGQISGWKYQPLGGTPIVPGEEPDGTTGASTRWGKIAYNHEFIASEAQDTYSDATSVGNADVYTLGGVKVGTIAADTDLHSLRLAPGVYVIRRGNKASKLLIR
ncbi:MAG: hypothetical protein K1V76_08250 [Candidatus Amulumruptor sp.]